MSDYVRGSDLVKMLRKLADDVEAGRATNTFGTVQDEQLEVFNRHGQLVAVRKSGNRLLLLQYNERQR